MPSQMNNRLLILGANGMLGCSLFRYFSRLTEFEVLGTVRSEVAKRAHIDKGFENLVSGVELSDSHTTTSIIQRFRPDYVLNCVGIVKQVNASKLHIPSIVTNSLLPHQLASECNQVKARLIHFSTDCVFSGRQGLYTESDLPDAIDLYGRSKLLGEVDYGRHLTLRTSIIGHELGKSRSLIDWFLSQNGLINGYNKAIFSGLPTVYVAEFLRDFVFGKELSGLYHLSADPIDKYSLLSLVNDFYLAEKCIQPSKEVVIDRSLDSGKLFAATGFTPGPWPKLIEKMREEYLAYFA